MSILYPLMALGALAVGVPIWLHLRRRDESNLVEFSTLRFLDDQPIAKARPMWPQNWPLLLLRMLALLLLVAAFAWPYVEDKNTVIVDESRVYILDNTLSHQVDDSFRTARDAIATELAANDQRTQIAVIELATTAKTLVRFGDDPVVAADTVGQLAPSAERGNFLDAFRSATEMLGTSLGTERHIILLSDSQANQWAMRENAPPFLQPNIEVSLPTSRGTTPANLSLSDPMARRTEREGRPGLEAAVTLTRQVEFPQSAKSQPTPQKISVVFLDRGREVFRKDITLEPKANTSIASGTVVAEWEANADQWVLGEVIVETDGDALAGDDRNALAGDDRVVFSLPPQRAGRVELITESLFLRRALAPQVMKSRWEVQNSDSSVLVDRQGEAPPDVLCVDGQALMSAKVRDAVRDDLSRGGGVMLMVDQATPLITGFLRELGIEMPPDQPTSISPATFRYVFAEHPVFAPFQFAEMGNLEEIEFNSYRRLKVREASPLAFSASGDPLLFESMLGPGRMLVFAFAFERQDTNWPIHPTFIPFLDKCLEYLRGQSTSVAGYEPGESVAWELPPGTIAEQITVSRLDPTTGKTDSSETDSVRIPVVNLTANFLASAQPGHYGIQYSEGDRIDAILDVNPSPLESDLRYDFAPTAVASWTQPDDRRSLDSESATDAIQLAESEALRQPYGWYLILAAIAAFVTESVYGIVASRRTNP
ncbi:MAG: BatA domain-containing protein [Rubripirellula sp.]|nr:BatA domain-containing protein [Rubripirellula sp.]